MPTNLLVGDATAVCEEGSAAGIGAGAAVDDGVGVAIVTPFAWASLSFSQNFFQWIWMQNGDYKCWNEIHCWMGDAHKPFSSTGSRQDRGRLSLYTSSNRHQFCPLESCTTNRPWWLDGRKKKEENFFP